MFYYYWWTLRKHIKQIPVGYSMTEFLVGRSCADKYNPTARTIGHHIYESRWSCGSRHPDQAIHTWYQGNEGGLMKKIGKFGSRNIDVVLGHYLADGNMDFLKDILPDLEKEYSRWEKTHHLPNELCWQGNVQGGIEEPISDRHKRKYVRPTINGYMYTDAKAFSDISILLDNPETAHKYGMKADSPKTLVQDKPWDEKYQSFEILRGDTCAAVHEAIGFIPQYSNPPDREAQHYAEAWRQTMDEKGFAAPYGLTTVERHHLQFHSHGVGRYERDDAIRPFVFSQTLTAMASSLNNYPQNDVLIDSTYFHQMELCVESQYHRGRPHTGEYLGEKGGIWLTGDRERSRYYNHSTFNDLIITSLVGLRPRLNDKIEANPLIPAGEQEYLCLDNVSYHGCNIAIIWDRYGSRYHHGNRLTVLAGGRPTGHSEKLERSVCKMNQRLYQSKYSIMPFIL